MTRSSQEDHLDRPLVLVLASTYPRWAGDHEPGFVHELSKRLSGAFRVIVLCPHERDSSTKENLDGVEIVRYRYAPRRWESLVSNGGITVNLQRNRWKVLLLPTFLLSQLWTAWRLTREEVVGVVHAHWLLPQGLVAALLQYMPGRKVPFVVTSHGADVYALRGRVMTHLKRFVLRRAASATTVSAALRDSLKEIGAGLCDISVSSMGVDMADRFFPDPGTPRSPAEILFVGRLVEKKGVQHLIEAMPSILAARPDARLRIAGFGPEEPRLRARVDEMGISTRVEFIGAVSQTDLPVLYRRAAVLVAPFVVASSGDQEGLGLVLVEAIGCGCPVIAGDVPAVADVPVRRVEVNAASIARAVAEVLSAPEERALEVERSRAYCLTRFGWENVAEKYAITLHGALGVNRNVHQGNR